MLSGSFCNSEQQYDEMKPTTFYVRFYPEKTVTRTNKPIQYVVLTNVTTIMWWCVLLGVSRDISRPSWSSCCTAPPLSVICTHLSWAVLNFYFYQFLSSVLQYWAWVACRGPYRGSCQGTFLAPCPWTYSWTYRAPCPWTCRGPYDTVT